MKKKYKSNFYVITGGPGVGKTSLIEALQEEGISCVPEVARVIIKEQMEQGGLALPWADKVSYSEMMLQRSVIDFENYSGSDEIHFFDRGIPDTYAYCKLINIGINDALKAYAKNYRYNPTVFILPPWEEIYHTDDERKQDFQEAIDTFRFMKLTYLDLGYNLKVVPKSVIAERVDFILGTLRIR